MTLLQAAGAVYFLAIQYYVLPVELALNAILGALLAGQLLVGGPFLAGVLCA